MIGKLKLKAAPAEDPLTVDKAKAHLRILPEDNIDNQFISDLITAAVGYIEDFLGRSLITQTWEIFFNDFPLSSSKALQIYRPNLISVTSVKYFDENDVEQTWSSSLYQVDTVSTLGIICPIPNESWPTTNQRINNVTIEFVSGYGAAGSAVPPAIIHALKLMIGELYNRREEAIVGAAINVVPISIQRLITTYRIYNI